MASKAHHRPAKRGAAFSKAFQEYPYDGAGVLYNSPVQVGPANPLYLKPTGYSATMVGIPYDDLDKWRGPYPANVFDCPVYQSCRRLAVGHSTPEDRRQKGSR